ncbi:MAG: bifunctional hydroxymethylpyrimidine kinase/phosphomethylpyrimidine kinase [Neptuniibacter sp.]
MSESIQIFNALTIAGSDSGGGAGIQADLKTFSALGVFGTSAITAITAQNTRTLLGITPVEADFIKLQLKAVFDDIEIRAVKTGMLGDSETVKVVSECLKNRHIPIVVDPVMIAKSGNALLRDDAVSTLINELLPLAFLVTPNLPEAAAILNRPEPRNVDEMRTMAQAIQNLGANAVLLKGGHMEGDECQDVLFDGSDFYTFSMPRISTENTHGTGCTLASAITAFLAKGESLVDAVAKAKQYITAAVKQADKLNVGGGHGPVNHFHAFWK